MLSVVLSGIAAGGLLYTLRRANGQPSLNELAVVLGLFGATLAMPLALGDRLAVFAFHLNQMRGFGFGDQIAAWLLIASSVCLAPSIVAGYQFPLIVGLLGKGKHDVGRHVGQAYAINTLGAICGSLATGLWLLPAFGAVSLWKAEVILVSGLCLSAVAASWLLFRVETAGHTRPAISASLTTVIFAVLCLAFPEGATSVWRHVPIGYGERIKGIPNSPADLTNWIQSSRFGLLKEFEGRESHIGIMGDTELGFYVNGKSDGSAKGDAGPNIMIGILPAMLHRNPKSACVVGLGTGSTAGWLADVPGVERLDVIEFEPKVVEICRLSETANRSVLAKQQVNLQFGDAREVLLVGNNRYDVITSLPSNPYRAGVANLYTQDFYQIIRERLEPGGIFFPVDPGLRDQLRDRSARLPHIAVRLSDCAILAGRRRRHHFPLLRTERARDIGLTGQAIAGSILSRCITSRLEL